jgi:16S rRNA (guanine(1405)-N(7))-methyltransferase
MSDNEKALDSLVESIAATTKYKNVSPQLVRNIGARELAKGVSLKTAVKSTKGKLHQVGGAYQVGRIDYDAALQTLRAASSAEDWRKGCREIMSLHASTRERLPILDDFYPSILSDIAPSQRVLDIACGLNPLAASWMPLAGNAQYLAYDIYSDMMQFMGDYMQLARLDGRAEVRDVIHNPPSETVDLALLLKTLPCLEQIEKGASERLLDTIRARYLLISYPVSSLGRRHKGMIHTYDTQFAALLEGRNWTARRYLFSSELAFLVDTAGGL